MLSLLLLSLLKLLLLLKWKNLLLLKRTKNHTKKRLKNTLLNQLLLKLKLLLLNNYLRSNERIIKLETEGMLSVFLFAFLNKVNRLDKYVPAKIEFFNK